MYQDVKAWHEAFGATVNDSPVLPTADDKRLRLSLMWEEMGEVERAMNDQDIVGIADGIADLIWVALGTAITYGIPIDKVWEEVKRSNFSKMEPDGTIHRRADGKILKPASWTPPDIHSIIQEATGSEPG